MFSDLGGTKRRANWAVPVSIGSHLLLLAFLLWYHARPVFVTPSSLAMGNGDKSYRIVYFAPAGATNQPDPDERKALLLARAKMARKHKAQEHQQQTNAADKIDANNKDASAGSAYGSLFSGAYDGHDVRPAYPVVYPDPPVSRTDFPEGFQGDVIVEVTIDKLGNVTDLKLLRGVGRGIDDKVLATLRNWRYKPAMMDGEPIAEKHDVHFHYPS